MPKSNKSINQELYDLLDTKGFDPETYDSSGKRVPLPDDAEIIQFHFHHGGVDHGTVTVTIDGLQKMKVYYSDDIVKSSNGMRDEGAESSWTTLLKQLKKFATKRQLGFSLANMDKLGRDMEKREATQKLEEGYYGTRSTSFSDNTPRDVKLVIKHNKKLEENDKRYRFIDKIFVENVVGERLLCPTLKPSEGRVFARHIVEGGQYRDERWNHIAEMCEDIKNLSSFVRATRTKQFNESVGRVVNEATEHYGNLRETMRRLQSGRGYNQYFDNWRPAIMEDDEQPDYASMFSQSTVDPRIERAFPVLGKLNIRIQEMAEVNEFESWADSIIQEELEPATRRQVQDLVELLGRGSEPMPVGADASSAIGELADIIEDESLNSELRQAAAADPDNDARPVIIGWMEQHRDNPVYDEVLNKLENSGNEEQPQPTPRPAPAVAQVKPQQPTQKDASQMPALAESDELQRILHLIGRK
jgi:hypothetical protein